MNVLLTIPTVCNTEKEAHIERYMRTLLARLANICKRRDSVYIPKGTLQVENSKYLLLFLGMICLTILTLFSTF